MTTVSDQASRLRALVRRLDPRGPDAPPAERAAAPRPDGPRDRAAPVIAIASGKGGVGKTTTSVNLSIALSKLGKRVTLLDADIGMANADVVCGLMPHLRLDKTVGAGEDDNRRSLSEIAIEAPGGFRLVPGSVGLGRVDELGDDELAQLVGRLVELERSSDLVLIDTSAGLGEGVRRFVFAADLTLIIATPEPTSIADAYALVKVLVGMQADDTPRLRMALVVNQAKNEREALDVHDRIGGVAAKFLGYPLPMLGYIRKDDRVAAAIRRRTPFMVATPRSAAGKDCLRLAEGLIRAVEA